MMFVRAKKCMRLVCPSKRGGAAFPHGVHMENQLRILQGERVALRKLCIEEKRDAYEYGKESKLVQICLRHLQGTAYQEVVDKLLQEVKLRREFEARLPKMVDGTLVLPDAPGSTTTMDDWDFRNFSTEWLPSWADDRMVVVRG